MSPLTGYPTSYLFCSLQKGCCIIGIVNSLRGIIRLIFQRLWKYHVDLEDIAALQNFHPFFIYLVPIAIIVQADLVSYISTGN